MKDKILNALKQEYAHLGLGDGILSGLAEMLAGTKLVTDENLQGIVAGLVNIVTTGIVGTILCVAYAASKPKKGSLKEED